MSMPDAFKTTLCQAFTDNVDHLSLHTDDPGTDGSNDSGLTHAVLSWTTPSGGLSSATALFEDLTGTYTHIGLWEGTTFRQGIECSISYTAAADVSVTVTHTVRECVDYIEQGT